LTPSRRASAPNNWLEYATLAWNVVGIVLVLAAAAAARSVALRAFGLDSLIEIVASAVVVEGRLRLRLRRRLQFDLGRFAAAELAAALSLGVDLGP
jgi:hypothetical protein